MDKVKIVVVLLSCFSLASGQRTYQRTCDCEYTVDGKCAYTLVLPTGGGSEGSCPTDSSSGDGGDELQMHLEQLKANLSGVEDWVAEQGRMIAQLQNTLLVEVIGKLAEITGGGGDGEGCEGCSTLQAIVNDHTSNLETLAQRLQEKDASIRSINDTVSEALMKIEKLQAAQAAAALQQNNTVNNINSLEGRVQADIADVRMNNFLCQQKGLIISGTKKSIPDDKISASSIYNLLHTAVRSRIFAEKEGNMSGGWCPSESNDPQEPEEPNKGEEWLQYDLGSPQVIYGVVTRGRADHPQWVTDYKLSYATEAVGKEGEVEIQWMLYKDILGEQEMFQGNKDQDSAKVNMLWQPIKARWVRITATAANDLNKCMRADLIGCTDS